MLNGIPFPDTAAAAPVRAYLLAQDARKFEDPNRFLADDIVFNGLVLQTSGAAAVAGAMNEFLPMIDDLRIEAVAEVEPGRFMVLYWFKLMPQPEAQPLCDHIIVENGRIQRVDNIFDLRKMPAAD